MADIFIRRLFRKRGPYTEEEVRTWIREGKVSPRTPAWREGMVEWKPLSEWGFLTAAASPRRRFQPSRRMNYEEIVALEPGFTRMEYVIMNLIVNGFILLALWVMPSFVISVDEVLMDFMKDTGIKPEHFAFGSLLHIVLIVCASLWVVMKRLENIGWHWGWAMLSFVPVVNVFLGLAMLGLPPGYGATKKLDWVAWAWILFLALLLGFVFAAPNVREAVVKFGERIINPEPEKDGS